MNEKIVSLFSFTQEGYRYYKLSSLPRYNLNNQNQKNIAYNPEINHAVCVKKQLNIIFPDGYYRSNGSIIEHILLFYK